MFLSFSPAHTSKSEKLRPWELLLALQGHEAHSSPSSTLEELGLLCPTCSPDCPLQGTLVQLTGSQKPAPDWVS